MGNTAQPAQQPETEHFKAIKKFIDGEAIKKKFESMLGARAPQFVASLMQIISNDKSLKTANIESIYNAAVTAAIINLPLNNNLGFAYIVPFKDNRRGGQVFAQLQIGYRGFIQLGQRTGQYKRINAVDVRQGELIKHDRLTDECQFEWEQDEEKRAKLPVIGYVSYFSLVSGFEKMVYWPVKKVEAHASKYSQSYNSEKSIWHNDFEAMALKTVLKANLSKYGPMTMELTTAIQADQAVIKSIGDGEDPKFDYVDNPVDGGYAEEISDEEAAEIERKAREDQAQQATEALKAQLDKKK